MSAVAPKEGADSDDSEYEYVADSDDDTVCANSSAAEPKDDERLKRAILESAREAGALLDEGTEWGTPQEEGALIARLAREHDEHVAHELASLSKDKLAPSSRVQTDLEIAMALQDEEDAERYCRLRAQHDAYTTPNVGEEKWGDTLWGANAKPAAIGPLASANDLRTHPGFGWVRASESKLRPRSITR